jgi:bacterial translation initiation factor 3 (bIF-3)
LRSLTKFLNDGDKTKITLRYRGREMAHREIGVDLLKRIEKDLEEIAIVEQFPKMEGRQMVMVMAPKKKNNCKNDRNTNYRDAALHHLYSGIG